jgi:hypothetical protein
MPHNTAARPCGTLDRRPTPRLVTIGLRPLRSRIASGELADHKPALRPLRSPPVELTEHRVQVNKSIHEIKYRGHVLHPNPRPGANISEA